jgi:hypothetical protein
MTALVFAAASAFARIGETEKQIEARYGKAVQTLRATKAYSYKGFLVIVAFDNGVSGVEIYQKHDASPMSAAPISTQPCS